MTDADFMIAIGCRFDDRLTGNPKTFSKNAKVVHIDVDPAEIGKIDFRIVDEGSFLS